MKRVSYPSILAIEVTMPPLPKQIGDVLPKVLELAVQDICLAVIESIPQNNTQDAQGPLRKCRIWLVEADLSSPVFSLNLRQR